MRANILCASKCQQQLEVGSYHSQILSKHSMVCKHDRVQLKIADLLRSPHILFLILILSPSHRPATMIQAMASRVPLKVVARSTKVRIDSI